MMARNSIWLAGVLALASAAAHASGAALDGGDEAAHARAGLDFDRSVIKEGGAEAVLGAGNQSAAPGPKIELGKPEPDRGEVADKTAPSEAASRCGGPGRSRFFRNPRDGFGKKAVKRVIAPMVGPVAWSATSGSSLYTGFNEVVPGLGVPFFFFGLAFGAIAGGVAGLLGVISGGAEDPIPFFRSGCDASNEQYLGGSRQ